MSEHLLSVIIPAFNESRYIYNILERVTAVQLIENVQKELVVVDDHSTDNTGEEVARFMAGYPHVKLQYVRHEVNQGKGAALRTGIQKASGEYLIIQDADLEYDPAEFNRLLKPMLKGVADVVFGSRFMGNGPHRILFFWHTIGNKFLTSLSNALTNLNLTDMETCYKLFRSHIIKQVDLKENRFGFEPEVTAKISRIPKIRIYEVGIAYYGRTYEEGKKINYKDGFRAIYCILKYNLFARQKTPISIEK
ncbi:Glycosyltransferase involved in cell wall bisynthesis [Chitinophaga sp. YR573]|uniref:glycosyltransferase family 2 protein n=1 Tax=Chitinophaga sp. YR573 TaxID=1881040 RepID=UPI0008AC3C41|nr:glycosyltransferase family 2 protein [Chitinophaga sp. YR573]SEW03196.1 Glycosyltransferase involved in cell wall bisynthesis [Chitinophaga sp. YR573]